MIARLILRLAILAGLLAIVPVFPPVIVVVFLSACALCPRAFKSPATHH